MPRPDRLTNVLLKKGRTGFLLVAVFVLAAILAPVFCPYDPVEAFDQEPVLAAPSLKHPLGTDRLARDMFARVVYGARISLFVGISAAAIAVVVGTVVGVVSAYFGGVVDSVLMRVTDVFFAFPGILLAVAVSAALDRTGALSVAVVLGSVGWPLPARIVRSRALTVCSSDHVLAARALGCSHRRILFVHVLPNCLGPVAVAGSLAVAGSILAEAGLSFLGLGVPDPDPSWGRMLAEALTVFRGHCWVAFFPGAAIAFSVLGFNLLGDALRDALDVRSPALERAGV